ncbi:prepilin peptidase [Candidatus Falkowbacteria bacterium]|nr:prepilin peptidase [Candidatus Falkowbacteria bacterium]
MTFLILVVFVLGLLIGSFLNCLIWRLHEDETILGRSYCPSCHHQLAWYDNIPLLSYSFLGGKCRYCHKKISIQYPAVELATGLLFALAFWVEASAMAIVPAFGANPFNFIFSPFSLFLLKDWFIIAVMMVVFIYDLRWYMILDKVTLPAMLVVIAFNLYFEFVLEYPLLTWRNWLISGIIGCSFFLMQFVATKGKGIGGGDLRLGLLMGLALGLPKLFVAIMLAYLVGAIVGLSLMAAGKKEWGSKLPLGVFLAPATVFALFYGEQIWQLLFPSIY